MSNPIEFHSTLSRTYHTLCISVRQPITEVKAECNVAADVWEIENRLAVFLRLRMSSSDPWQQQNYTRQRYAFDCHVTISSEKQK